MMRTIRWQLVTVLLAMAIPATPAMAVKVGDIAHLQGSRVNRLTGFGLVVGLNGTGDGSKSVVAMRALAAAYGKLGAPVLTLDEIKDTKNVAIVFVEATLPQDGAREGERVSVRVSSSGSAKSLVGGTLLPAPLVGPNPDDPTIMAMASGVLHVEDRENPTTATIAQGATLEQNWIHNYIVLGRDLDIYRTRSIVRPLDWVRPDEPYVTLVLRTGVAQWGVAATIADAINDDEAIGAVTTGLKVEQYAVAFDPRTVVVRIPAKERLNPSAFLARILEAPLLMPRTEARVTINRRAGTIDMTANVEIAPGISSAKGMSIVALPPGVEKDPPLTTPRPQEQEWWAADTQRKGGARLRDLWDAMNQLKVPVDDRISIIQELDRSGRLYAKLIVDE